MNTVHATFQGGRLELMQPVDWPEGTRAEVIPLIQASPSPHDAATSWPPGFFEQTAGSLAGEDFDRPPQGNVPTREGW